MLFRICLAELSIAQVQVHAGGLASLNSPPGGFRVYPVPQHHPLLKELGAGVALLCLPPLTAQDNTF